jgi:hypothetical protein
MVRRVVTFVWVVAILAIASVASAQEFKVKLAGTDQDRKTLLEKLNENGKEHGVSFVEAASGYQYRVAIYAESAKASDMLFGGGADASAVILDPNCEVVSVITRGGRATKGGAVNALSKEVAKKFKQMAATR